MLRTAFLALMLTVSASAAARTGPEVAYASGNEIYLINPDGTGQTRIYRGKGSGFIDSVSLKPGGGAIAFIDNWVLKFMTFSSTGQAGPITSVPGCYRQHEVQYSPDGQFVIYGELCGDKRLVKRIAVPTAENPSPTAETLFENGSIVDLGNFDAAGQSFVYTVTDEVGWQIRRHFMSGDDVLVTSMASPGPQLRDPAISPDGGRVTAADWNGSIVTNGTGYLDEFSAANGAAIRSNFTRGKKGVYDPSGTRTLFAVTEGRTTYLRILDSNGIAQNVARATSSLAFNDFDWGN